MYIDTHQKSYCLSEIYVSADTICSKNHEQMLKKDFALKYFLEVSAVVILTNLTSPSVINHILQSLCLELVIIYP